MPDAYEIHDGQFLQLAASAPSAAGGLFVNTGAVPAGRVWTILSAFVNCSVAETQTYWFAIYGVSDYFPITNPASVSINPVTLQYYPMLREGMEVKLFPGEFLFAFRGAATAGSTISISARYIETDLPFYEELDKYANKARFRRAIDILSPRRSAGGSSVYSPRTVEGGGGRGRGSER